MKKSSKQAGGTHNLYMSLREMREVKGKDLLNGFGAQSVPMSYQFILTSTSKS